MSLLHFLQVQGVEAFTRSCSFVVGAKHLSIYFKSKEILTGIDVISLPLSSFILTPFVFLNCQRKNHLFILQVESPIICPLLEEMDAYGLFQGDDS